MKTQAYDVTNRPSHTFYFGERLCSSVFSYSPEFHLFQFVFPGKDNLYVPYNINNARKIDSVRDNFN